MKTLVKALVVMFLCVAAAHGQVVPISGQVINQYGQPLANAQVRVCSVTSTGTPCTPTTPIYLDYGLTMAAPNPYIADAFGNYTVYVPAIAAPNLYVVQLSPATGTTWSYIYPGPSLSVSTACTVLTGGCVQTSPSGSQTVAEPAGATLSVTSPGLFTGANGATFKAIVNGASPAAIYNHFTSAGTPFDAAAFGVVCPSTGSQYQCDAVGGYTQNNSTTTQATSGSFYTYNAVTNGLSFAGNFGLIDAAGNPWLYGKGVEIDLQPQGTASQYLGGDGRDFTNIGLQVSLFAPNTGQFGTGVWINRGQTGQWDIGIKCEFGASAVCLSAEPQSATVFPSSSSLIKIEDLVASGAVETNYIYSTTNQLVLDPSPTSNLIVSSGNLSLLGTGAVISAPEMLASSTSNTIAGLAALLNTSASTTNLFGLTIGVTGSGTSNWTAAIRSQPGAANLFAWVGQQASGNGQGSQQIRLDATNSSGTVLSDFIAEDDAGNLDLTPQSSAAVVITQGNLMLTSGHVTTQYVTGGFLGSSTFPTGSCSPNGLRAFSQDGTISTCSSGTWGAAQVAVIPLTTPPTGTCGVGYIDSAGTQHACGLSGTTATITGTALTTGTCDSGSVTIAGATVGHPVGVSTTTGADIGGSLTLKASVTSTNTVSVFVCNPSAGTVTPTNYAYNVTTY